MPLSRRQFLQTSVVSGLALDQGIRGLFFSRQAEASSSNILITIFLRGGADFVNWVVPSGGPDRSHYESARPETQIPVAELASIGDSPFGFHPAAAPMTELFDEGRLAIVMGAGLTANTRSHFDAQRFMNYGTAGEAAARTGWMARLLAPNLVGDPLLPAVAMGTSAPRSFSGSNQVVAVPRLDGFGFPSAFFRWRDGQRTALRQIYERGDSPGHVAGLRAITGSNALELHGGNDYEPASGVEYPATTFAESLGSLAQLIKSDVGLHAATIDIGGWDTHNAQNGRFEQLVGTVSEGLAAFYADLDARPSDLKRTTVVVMSEFGRRIQENASAGTDHGHGGGIFVLGGSVNGGFHGEWPGLERSALYDGADLATTTDYRRVLSDIAIRQLGDNRLGALFPGYENHEPMGLVEGEDIEPDYTTVDQPVGNGPSDDSEEAPDAGDATSDESSTDTAAAAANDGDGGNTTTAAVVGGGVGLAIGAAAVAGFGAMAKRRQEVASTDAAGDQAAT